MKTKRIITFWFISPTVIIPQYLELTVYQNAKGQEYINTTYAVPGRRRVYLDTPTEAFFTSGRS
jgi:hypothetical protein